MGLQSRVAADLCPARSTIGEAGEPEASEGERRKEGTNKDDEEEATGTGNLDKKIQHERGEAAPYGRDEDGSLSRPENGGEDVDRDLVLPYERS